MLDSSATRRASIGRTPLQEEYGLFSEQVLHAEGHARRQLPAPGVERRRAFDSCVYPLTQLCKVFQRAEVRVGALVPGLREVLGPRHAAPEKELSPDLPVPKVRERDNHVAP